MGDLSALHQRQMFGLLEIFLPTGTLSFHSYSFHHIAEPLTCEYPSVSLLPTTKILLQNVAQKKNSVACSPQATAAFRRSQCQLLQIEGVALSAQRIPTAVNFHSLDWSRHFLETVPQLSSRG
jgi:hypothetical protein